MTSFLCIVCMKIDGRKKGTACVKCGLYVHRSCSNFDVDQFNFLIESDTFECTACKFSEGCFSSTNPISNDCCICMQKHKTKVIIKCSNCHKSHHRACVANSRSLNEIKKNIWQCMEWPFSICHFPKLNYMSSLNFLKKMCIIIRLICKSI
jgi:hypothetical protein